MHNIHNVEFLMQLTQQTIYLMGVSFLLGSLSTIFILLILDMVRSAKLADGQMPEEDADDSEDSRAA